MHKNDIQCFRRINHRVFIFVMNNMKSNYDRFFLISKSVFNVV